jgi:acetoin utilization protein AcuB
MQVSEIMTSDPVAVSLAASIGQAWDLLRKAEIRHLPVVSSDGVLIGIVSDRDFGVAPVSLLIDDILARPRVYLEAPIATIMTASPMAVQADAPVADVVQMMVEERIGAVPVVERDGKLIGIVSYLDILRNIQLAESDPFDVVGAA